MRIVGHVQFEDLKAGAADVRISSTLELSNHTSREIGLALLAKHTGKDVLHLDGRLPVAMVFPIEPAWQPRQREYLVSYRKAGTPL